MDAQGKQYVVGIMEVVVSNQGEQDWRNLVKEAVDGFKSRLSDLNLVFQVFEFSGPHLTPAGGGYEPLDFLQIGMSEKVERKLPFLLVVTEVDLSASNLTYTLAYPSQLTNIGILSTKRLSPSFWGHPPNPQRTQERLATLLLHTLGHLVGLVHSQDPKNAMFNFQTVQDLDGMSGLNAQQKATIRKRLPSEAHEKYSRGNRTAFFFSMFFEDFASILRAVVQANPLHLLTQMPTMITAAVSIILAFFFSTEMWDLSSSSNLLAVGSFAAVAILVSVIMLYQSFTFGGLVNRKREVSESTIVSEAAIMISLVLVVLLQYVVYAGLVYLTIVTFIPHDLMKSWPSSIPAVTWLDHLRMSMFLSSIGVIGGTLGGRADSKKVIRHAMFLDEQS